MSAQTLRKVVFRLAVITGTLILSLAFGLTKIAVLPTGTPPCWAFISPMLAGLIAMTMVIRGSAAIKRGADPGLLANLPARAVIVYGAAAVLGIWIGALVEPHSLIRVRPLTVVICAPALVAAHVTVLRAFILRPWIADLTSAPSRPGSPDPLRSSAPTRKLSGMGVLSIRSSLTLAAGTTALVALALIGVHIHSLAQFDNEQTTLAHLRDLHQIAQAQASHLPRWKLEQFFGDYPESPLGVPVLIDNKGRVVAPGTIREMIDGSTLSVLDGGERCSLGSNELPCVVGPRMSGAPLSLVTLSKPSLGEEDPTVESLGTYLLFFAFVFFAFAALLGRAIGGDISRDFHLMTNQLRAMARQDELDLGRPVTVTSIDEVGDLTAHLGRLRARLEKELAGHRESLRQAQEADRTKNAFFSNVSRELRTPLTTLCGYSQLLLEDEQLSASQLEDIQSIHNGGRQLLSLVNDVLDISVIESGFLKLSREEVDVGALAREVVRSQSGAMANVPRRHAVDLEIEVAPGLPTINADPARIRQVLQNLTSNALKFTNKGSVTIRVRRHAMGVEVEVTDTGIGISQAELPHIFDRYRQAGDLSLRRKGSGLGLAICKHLVQLHGGAITVESQPDHGTTFAFTLPAPEAPRVAGDDGQGRQEHAA